LASVIDAGPELPGADGGQRPLYRDEEVEMALTSWREGLNSCGQGAVLALECHQTGLAASVQVDVDNQETHWAAGCDRHVGP
jgi:hypothetical protein